uniref:Uncharacterized protein MANES_10G094700 n=1 Tax=Rhizophora mucronata TaxID=61149 RepID=A0A2P2MJI4_RHIMU
MHGFIRPQCLDLRAKANKEGHLGRPGEEFCSGAMETNLDLDQFPYLQQGEMSWRKRKRSKRKEKDERNGIKEFLTVITTNWIRI